MPQPREDPAGCQGALPHARWRRVASAPATIAVQSSPFAAHPLLPYLPMVYHAPIGVDALQAAVSGQLRRLVRTPQAEALAPAQQELHVVEEVVALPAEEHAAVNSLLRRVSSLRSMMQPSEGTHSIAKPVAAAPLCIHFLAGCGLLEAPAADPSIPLVACHDRVQLAGGICSRAQALEIKAACSSSAALISSAGVFSYHHNNGHTEVLCGSNTTNG